MAILVAVAAVHTVQAAPYKRSLYKHWIDADQDCQDTRQEVLISESLIAVTLDRRGCKVIKGRWYDPYTGRTFTSPKSLDIDHFVPLKEVHLSGGSRWSAARRQAYANDLSDPNTLIAVSAGANRSKGFKDPAKWMPSNKAFHCDYIRIWVSIKTRWNLSMETQEQCKIQEIHTTCSPLRPLFDGLRFFIPDAQ